MKYRATPAQRQRVRFLVTALALFISGMVVGSLTAPSSPSTTGSGDRRNGGKALIKAAQNLEGLVGANPSLDRSARRESVVKAPGADLALVKKAPSQREQRLVPAGDDAAAGNASSEPGRGLHCPPEDPNNFNDLQIPLKHLPRGKKTSVAEKYNRRAHNCAGNGIWNRVTIEDHHKILHNMVRLGRIKKHAFVLDWGSGCGHSLQFLFDEYDTTGVGIDVSSQTIAYARTNTTRANLHCVADGTKLEWIPSNFFDHAISFGSIYHVYNRTMFCHVLRQLVRVVKPGGTVYNGWTENAEYKRDHVAMCFGDLDVTADVLEEKKEFADVAIFPLKAQQDVPNTYSLVVTKRKATEDERPFLFQNIPITCGVHKCEPRNVAERREDENNNAVGTDAPRGKEDDVDDDKSGWPTCPPYDANIEALQIPLEHLPRKKKTSVSQKYDRRAHNCASHGVWHRVTIQDHEAILKKVGELLDVKREQILFDWGSGCGHQLEFMTRMFSARGLGIDVSNLTIAYATANTTKANRHCVADGTRLEWLPTDFFHHAYSFGSIYHVYNKTRFCHVLQEMVRMVKPGGRVYNGWTENGEFHRNDVVKCINTDTSSHHKIEILEEGDLFHHVKNFPLKQYRKVPNTYSLLITKAG